MWKAKCERFPPGYSRLMGVSSWLFGLGIWYRCVYRNSSRFLNLVCVSFTCCIFYSDAHTKTALLCHIQHSNMLIYSFKAILLNFKICCWAFVNVFSVMQVIFTAFLTKHEFCIWTSWISSWWHLLQKMWTITYNELWTTCQSLKSTWKLNWTYLLRAH